MDTFEMNVLVMIVDLDVCGGVGGKWTPIIAFE